MMTGSKATGSTTASKKPVRRKTAAKATPKKTATSKAAPAKTTTKAATKTTATSRKKKQPSIITSEERHQMIAEAAYLIAEKRGFQGGTPEQDWLEAAAKIDSRIMHS